MAVNSADSLAVFLSGILFLASACNKPSNYVDRGSQPKGPASVRTESKSDIGRNPNAPAQESQTQNNQTADVIKEDGNAAPLPNVVVGVVEEIVNNNSGAAAGETVKEPAPAQPAPIKIAPVDPAIESQVPAAACPMYANTNSKLYCVRDGSGEVSGAFSTELIGSFQLNSQSITNITDVAISLGGKIYAISPTSLFLVDPTNAKLVLIKDINISAANALTVLSDGRLIVAGKGVALIDLANNQMQTIASTLEYASSGDIVGLPDKKLYWTVSSASGDQLAVVDVFAGTTRLLGKVGFNLVLGLAYAGSTLYGFTDNGRIFTIDQQSGGAVTTVKSDSTRWWGATTNPVKW